MTHRVTIPLYSPWCMGRGTHSPSAQPMTHEKLVLHTSWTVQGILHPWVMGRTEHVWCSVQHHMAHDPWAFCHSAWSMTHGEKIAEWARTTATDTRPSFWCHSGVHSSLRTGWWVQGSLRGRTSEGLTHLQCQHSLVLNKASPPCFPPHLTLTAPLTMPWAKSQQMVNTSKLSKKELEKLLHTREVEYQELSNRLSECLCLSGAGPHFTVGQSTLSFSDPVWRVCQSCVGVATHLESQVKRGFGLSGYHLLSSFKIVTLFESVCVEGAW